MERIWKDIPGYEGLYQVSNDGLIKAVSKIHKIRENCTMLCRERIMKPYESRGGYLSITLCKDKRKKGYLIHKIVALSFIPNPENKPFVDHIDTNRKNNMVENLRWCTTKENAANPITRTHLHEAMIGNKRALGHKFSEERNQRIADANRKRGPRSEDVRRKISATLTGKPGHKWTDEQREKMRVALNGKKKPQHVVEIHKKKVAQYSLNGELVKVWPSMTEAAQALGLDNSAIGKCVSGRYKSCGGYVWKRV